MSEISRIFKSMRRPGMLVRAARVACASYRRDKDLRRILRAQQVPAPGRGMARLLSMEADLEARRTDGAATYSIGRHIEVLAALIFESGLGTGCKGA